MNRESGAVPSIPWSRSGRNHRSSSIAPSRLATVLIALTAAIPATAEEDPGAQAARACATCHDRDHFEGLRWETYQAGLAEHPALDGVVTGLSEAERRAIGRHFGIPGTPEADDTADPRRR